jgi:hypothetical protein
MTSSPAQPRVDERSWEVAQLQLNRKNLHSHHCRHITNTPWQAFSVPLLREGTGIGIKSRSGRILKCRERAHDRTCEWPADKEWLGLLWTTCGDAINVSCVREGELPTVRITGVQLLRTVDVGGKNAQDRSLWPGLKSVS